MQSWFTFVLDGDECRVEREDTHRTLASFLAELDPGFDRFHGRDPWRGSDLVVLGDIEGDSHRFRVVDAGLLLLPMLAGRHVWTPEGIGNTEPDHPVNLALQDGHFECGPDRLGVLKALMFEGYYRPDLRRQGQTNDQFDTVATRTANAPAIREAAAEVFASTEQLRHEAAQRAERSGEERFVWTGRQDIFGDRFTKRLFQINERTPLSYVDAKKRRFHRPDSLVNLLRLKREYPDARFVAGGTGMTEFEEESEWANLISLEAVEELNSFVTVEEAWEIGAAVPLTQIAERIGRECLPFNKILRRFASRAIRNRATLGGYLATGWSRGQLTPLLMALNARVLLLSEEGERDAPISQFYRENGATILAPEEVVRSVVIPRFHESVLASRGVTSCLHDAYTAAPRRTLCEPYASAAFAIELRDRTVAKARLGYSGVGPHPLRAREAEEFLVGKTWEEATVFGVLPVLNDTVPADGDESPESGYRKQLAVTFFQKFFAQHPRPDSRLPESLTAVNEFARLDQPFFDVVPAS